MSGRAERMPDEPSMRHAGPADDKSALFQALIEDLADAVIFADREGRIQIWNAGAEAVFGYSPDEVLGHDLDVLIPERMRPVHWAGFHAAVQTGRMKHGREPMTTRSRHKDGSDLYVDLSFALVKDPTGDVLGAVAVARDITRRFQEEKQLRQRTAELEAQIRALSPGS